MALMEYILQSNIFLLKLIIYLIHLHQFPLEAYFHIPLNQSALLQLYFCTVPKFSLEQNLLLQHLVFSHQKVIFVYKFFIQQFQFFVLLFIFLVFLFNFIVLRLFSGDGTISFVKFKLKIINEILNDVILALILNLTIIDCLSSPYELRITFLKTNFRLKRGQTKTSWNFFLAFSNATIVRFICFLEGFCIDFYVKLLFFSQVFVLAFNFKIHVTLKFSDHLLKRNYLFSLGHVALLEFHDLIHLILEFVEFIFILIYAISVAHLNIKDLVNYKKLKTSLDDGMNFMAINLLRLVEALQLDDFYLALNCILNHKNYQHEHQHQRQQKYHANINNFYILGFYDVLLHDQTELSIF